MKQTNIAGVLENLAKRQIESYVDSKWYKGYYKECDVCGEMVLDETMETVIVDEERTPAMVCPACYYQCSEKAGLDPQQENLMEIEEDRQAQLEAETCGSMDRF